MVLLGRKISFYIISFLAVALSSPFVVAEEAIKVQTTPKIQAVNLAPIETNNSVVNLPSTQQPTVTVQTTPVVIQPPVQQQEVPAQLQLQQVQRPISQIAKPSVQTSQTTPANVSFDACTKVFPTNAETLLVLVLGAIEANGFTIKEFQSRGGFVTFTVQNKEFLATTTEVDNKTAMLKINPTNGLYYFAPGIVAKMFEYIDYKIGSSVSK